MTSTNVAQLETLFHLSIPWLSLPKYQIGDRVFCEVVGLERVITGIVFCGDKWLYFVKHNGYLLKVREGDCNPTNTTVQIKLPPFKLGDIVRCPSKEIARSLVFGILLNRGNYQYFIQDFNNFDEYNQPLPLLVTGGAIICNS